MLSSLLAVFVLLSAVAAQERLDFFEDDICNEENGVLWTCKALNTCPKAQKSLLGNRRPQMCNFSGTKTEPIVCCEPDVAPPLPTSSKSEQMCKKYAESVFLRLEDPLGEGYTSHDTCAVVEPLITNGKDAEAREYPHMALIGYGSPDKIQWLCGGSLISDRFVMSAGHCTDGGKKLGMAKWVRLGEHNLSSTEDESMGLAKSTDYEIIERINHPEYKPPSVYNDIALYKLNTTVRFNEYIRPICLQTNHTFAKTYAIATGWGRTEWVGKQSDVLQKVNLTITSRKGCSDAYQGAISEKLTNGIRDNTQLCAGDIDNEKDTCKGDSGGPLQLRLKQPYCMYSQVGITSFGAKCGGQKPGVYTRVSHFVPWIESIVWP